MAGSEQTKKHFLVLDQKRTRKNQKIYLSNENNLNRNAEAVSLRFICKKDVFKNFIILTGKHLCQILSFDKSCMSQDCNSLNKGLQHRCFPINFVKLLQNIYFVEHVQLAASGNGCAKASN